LFSAQPLTSEARFDPKPVRVRFVVKIFAMGQVRRRVFLFCPAIIISLKLHTHLQLQVALTRTKGRSLRTLKGK